MELRYIETWDYTFTESKVSFIMKKLDAFNPTKKEVNKGEYAVYINIDSIEQLDQLANVLGHHVVFGDVLDYCNDNHVCIEDYDGYRE